MQYAVVSTACAKERTVPSHCTDASVMSAKRSDKLALDCVPDLQITGMSANAKKCAVTGPLDACYAIVRADVI